MNTCVFGGLLGQLIGKRMIGMLIQKVFAGHLVQNVEPTVLAIGDRVRRKLTANKRSDGRNRGTLLYRLDKALPLPAITKFGLESILSFHGIEVAFEAFNEQLRLFYRAYFAGFESAPDRCTLFRMDTRQVVARVTTDIYAARISSLVQRRIAHSQRTRDLHDSSQVVGGWIAWLVKWDLHIDPHLRAVPQRAGSLYNATAAQFHELCETFPKHGPVISQRKPGRAPGLASW